VVKNEKMTVYIAKENNDPRQAIRKIFEDFKHNLDLSKGIFLKPNIVFPVKEKSGEITRHKIVRALVEVLREIDPKVDIVIGEGTAAGTDPYKNFKISGYSKLARDLGVQILNLDEVERRKVEWRYGILKLPEIAFERTYINLPILKPSSAAIISGAMKNQKGLLEPKLKKAFHRLGLHDPIAHFNKVIQPDLTVMDGINFFHENVLIAGDNTYEIDHLAGELLDVSEPVYLKTSREIGVGNDDFVISGEDAQTLECSLHYEPHKYKKVLRLRLWSNPRACSMCRFVFLNLKKFSGHDFTYSTIMKLKLMKYAITGAEIIFGSKPYYEHEYKDVICIGNCTKKIAKENRWLHVPGCPPTKDDMLRFL